MNRNRLPERIKSKQQASRDHLKDHNHLLKEKVG